MTDEEIKIVNINNKFREEYKINKKVLVEEKNLEKLIDNKNLDKITIMAKIIEKYIIIITVKLRNINELDNKNEKDIQMDNFNIIIIKYDSKNNNKQQININIPIKGEKIISKKIFFSQKFYFFDLIPIDDIKSFFFLYIFDQIHFFKLYQKDEKLKYNKINMKNFNKETNVFYIGSNLIKDKNILEIELLLKPNICFYFIPIDISDSNKKFDEIEYKLMNDEYTNVFNIFIRSNCDLFLFTDKKDNKNYIISKEDEKKEIILKELNTSNLDNNLTDELKIIYLFKISDKIYIISDMSSKEEDKYKLFGIYNIVYNENDNKYNMELLQQIKILNKEGIKEYNFNLNISNYLSINFGKKLYIIHLDQYCAIDIINIFEIDSKLLIEKYYFEKSQEITLLILFLNNDIFFSKLIDEFDKNEKYEKEEVKHNKKENENIILENNVIPNIASTENKENNINSKINDQIKKIILDRTEFHKKKLDKLVDEKKKKLKNIKNSLKLDKENYKAFKAEYDKISKVIDKLKEKKKEINDYIEEEREEEYENTDNYNNYNSFNSSLSTNINTIYNYRTNQIYNNPRNLMNQTNNPSQHNLNNNISVIPRNYNNQLNKELLVNRFYKDVNGMLYNKNNQY